MFNIKDVLEDLLLENELTIKETSLAVGIDKKLISNYIKGIYVPSLKNAIKLANYFNCSLDYLAGLSNNKSLAIYSKPDYQFYSRYDKLLKTKEISHYNLTKNLNMNKNVLHNWKRGILPPFSNLIKISDFLGTSLDYLIGRKLIKKL